MKSIVQEEKECFVCGTECNLHRHHIFGGTSNRKHSEDDGLTVYLCGYHHNQSNRGVHFDKDLNSLLKITAQIKWEDTYGTREEFIKRYGKSYL